MTFKEFKAWLQGYAEAMGPEATDVVRILEEAEKVQTQHLLPDLWNGGIPPLFPTNKDTLGGDCPLGTICMSSACPRALKTEY